MKKSTLAGLMFIFGTTSASATELPTTWTQTHQSLLTDSGTYQVARLVGSPFSYVLLQGPIPASIPMVDVASEEDPVSSCHWSDKATSVTTKTGLDSLPTYTLQENLCLRTPVRLQISYSGTQKIVYLQKILPREMSSFNVGVIGH